MIVAALVALMLLGGSALQPTWRSLPFAIWIVVAAAVITWRGVAGTGRYPVAVLLLALAPIALMLIQLCPLPVTWLDASTGQAFVHAVRALVQPGTTAPISVDRLATAVAGVPVAIFSATLLLMHAGTPRARDLTLRALALLGAASIALGAMQFLSGGQWGDFYHSPHAATAPGLFANRNHGALFLACCLAFFGAWIGQRTISSPARLTWFTAAAIPTLAVIAVTGSRAGLFIGAAMTLATLLALPHRGADRRRNAVGGVGDARIAVLLVVAGFATLAALVPLNGDTAGRLAGVSGDLRWSIWSTSRGLAALYWPWGSGLGTFAEVYAMAEPVGRLQPFFINHAHNDLLELLVECGILSVIPIAAALIFLASFVSRARQLDRYRLLECRVALIVIAGLLTHSLFDYPLRTPTLAIVLAIAFSFLSSARVTAARDAPTRAG